jgi:CRP-like cAMP-binding protein
MADSRTIPPPDFDDDDPAGQAAWEIATAETLRARGDLADAASWYRRAANHLMEAGDDERAIEVAKLAAELVALESAVRPASEREAQRATASTFPTGAPPAMSSTQPATIASSVAPASKQAEPPKPPQHPPGPAPGSAAARLFGASATTTAVKSAGPPPRPVAAPTHSSQTATTPSTAATAKPAATHSTTIPRPASVVPPPGGARPSVATPALASPATKPLVPGPQSRVPGPSDGKPPVSHKVPGPQSSLRPSAYAAPVSPAARAAEIPPPAKPPAVRAPSTSNDPNVIDEDATSVVALGDIASPIASLLDEAVANLDSADGSTATAASKRPLSFLPQRAAESESIAARLSALPLFSELPAEQLRQLSRQLITESRAADEHVCESGAPEGPLFVVLSGSAWVGVAGRASPLAVVTAGDVVGEIAALYGGPRTATVVAREPMELVGVAPSVLRAMARDFSAFRESLIESVTDRMSESLPHIATSLRRLTDEARKAILKECEFVELPEGAEMLVEGEPAPAMFLIAAGEAECFGGELGVTRAVRARVGEIVGASSTLTSTPSGVSARAARTLLAARVSREKMRELLKRIPSIIELLDDVAAPGRGVVC